MKEVITITDKAVIQLKNIIKDAPSNTNGIILSIKTTGCSGYSYSIDFANSNNSENFDYINKDGLKIYIDPKAVMFLIGSEMDYIVDKLSSRFIFNNPNEKSVCGCGESFNIN
tara:strand:+ start:581 stop:919 length:339 start_codon:yes stop_codon:yes gene_type:complete